MDPEALAGHFENVRQRYRDKSKSGGDDTWQEVPPMQENHSDEIRRIKGA